MERVKKLLQQVSEFWQSRNRAQKIKIILAGVVFIVIMGTIVYYATKPTYVPLYTNLDIKDAGEIVKKLDEEKIPYELQDNGKTILVDPKHKYKTRLKLAQEGLPKGDAASFSEVFDKTKLGTTDWERQVQYNQALQGELTRTIEEMVEVESARIHIVQPEKSSFIETEKNFEPTAAVALTVKPGETMEEESIRGIINLISHSVKGLKPENVTVIDQHGRILSDISLTPEELSKDAINDQIAIQSNFQKHLQTNVQTLLEQVFGPGNVAVRVNAKLNFDKRTVESKLFSPVDEEDKEGILRSVQELREHFNGTGTAPQGSPGVDSNVPGYNQQGEADSEYQKSEITRNYEVNEAHENLNVAPGAVDKLTVSVVVNRDLGEDEKYSIAQMVGNAIGYDPDRDQVSVEGIEFNNDLITTMTEAAEREEKQKMLKRYLALAGLALVGITGFILYRRRQDRILQQQEEELLAEELKAAQEAAAAEEEELEEPIDSSLYKNIERYARRRPEDVAKVLKTWLNED